MKYSSFALLFSKIGFFGGLVPISCLIDVPNQIFIVKNKKDEKITVMKNGYVDMKDIEIFEKVKGCKLIFEDSNDLIYNAKNFYEKRIKPKKPNMEIDFQNETNCKNGEYLRISAEPFLRQLTLSFGQ